DEAHRFAINFHRQKRSIGSLGSQPEEVPGIGAATINKLLIKFKSVKNIKSADKKALVAEIGASKTEKLLAGLK
ncbi:MAG: excinuclease ABC subunit UvrC, partial [Cyclobacteriaceae bacterium]